MSLKVHKGIMKFEKAKDLDNEKYGSDAFIFSVTF
jgi:hypothetical protein